jgi:hypothetical protein
VSTQTPNAPKLPAERLKYQKSITEILSDLSRPVPKRLLRHRVLTKEGGKVLTYIPWHEATRLLDFYAPGWEGHVVEVKQIANYVVVVYQITIHAAEGIFARQATGQESLEGKTFTDAICAAEQQAFKRAAARFGLGLDLYKED